MRRIFALLLLTPLLANCSDAGTPVAPSTPARALELTPADVTADAGWSFDNTASTDWTLDDWTNAGVSAQNESVLQSAPAPGALMLIGHPWVGSAEPLTHDDSFHARDRIVPGTVSVDVGEKVTFFVYPGHRVAIYKDGTNPQDIVPGTGPFVLDPNNRLVIQAAPVPVLSIAIHKPGKYLVICATTRHFVESNMWGWIIVK